MVIAVVVVREKDEEVTSTEQAGPKKKVSGFSCFQGFSAVSGFFLHSFGDSGDSPRNPQIHHPSFGLFHNHCAAFPCFNSFHTPGCISGTGGFRTSGHRYSGFSGDGTPA